ncbi:MAG: TIGR02444 family protein [Burkholderiales bacterium]
MSKSSVFWQFSLDFYARPRVAGVCLQLQDSAGVDVNLLLYLLFIATHQREVSRDDVARLDALVKAWREQAVLPLRTLRRKLKTGIEPLPTRETESLRSAVKRIELDAERVEQETLERLAPPASLGVTSAQDAAARANLAAYGAFLSGLPAAPVGVLLEAFAQTQC